MSQPFPHLCSPARIGSMQLKNRMVMSPMTTAYCNDDQTPSERLIRYFEERARGGVGLITLELVTVDEVHRYMHRSMTLADDSYIEAHRRLTDRIHAHGARVQPQISHTGPESVAPMFGDTQTLGPSVNVAPVWGWSSRPLDISELPAIARQYGEAARRAREAGYDGIELHAAHCYNLLASFLSPLRNKRTDEYSAFKAETRTRLIREVMAEIRARAGADFPVTLSLSGFERMPGGRALDDSARLAPELVAAGIDCFRVSGGISDSLVTMMIGRSDEGNGVNRAAAEAIRQVVDVPVMVVGRIHDPWMAEQIIASGQADLVAMARPLLADPFFPAKVIAGKPDRIRRCISCENCIDSMQMQDNLGCAVNPLSGREAELLPEPAPSGETCQQPKARSRKKVVIIGAGTAGMEAARQASEAGHEVVLMERQRRLGGSLWWASTVHSDNEAYLQWLLRELQRLPVRVYTNTEATPERVKQERADAVLVAVGGRVVTPPIDGVDAPGVLSGAGIRGLADGRIESGWLGRCVQWLAPCLKPALLRWVSRAYLPVGRRVIIVGGDLVAVELAEFLAHRGRRVHLLDGGRKLMPEVGKKRRFEHMQRLDTLQVLVNTGVEVLSVSARSVSMRVGPVERRLQADTVIVAGEVHANTDLADALRAAGCPVTTIGDCNGLGLIAGATRAATEAVVALDG